MPGISAYIAGLLLGVGLLISGMSNPGKILGFLDLFGVWDPSLGLVMACVFGGELVALHYAKRKSQSLCGAPTCPSSANRIDSRLLLGSIVFGVGLGLAGFWPSTAIVALGAGAPIALVFVLSMLVGILLIDRVDGAESSRQKK